MSNQVKAENLRYLYIFKSRLADKLYCGISLRSGYMSGIFVLIFFEILYYALGCSDFTILELLYIGLMIWSLIKVVIYFTTCAGIKKGHFDKLYLGYTLLTLFTLIFIFSSVVGVILYLFDNKALLKCVIPKLFFHLDDNAMIGVAVLYLTLQITVQLIVAYLGYSFTKKQGIDVVLLSNTTTSQSQEYTPPSGGVSALRVSHSMFNRTDETVAVNHSHSLRGSSNTFKSSNSVSGENDNMNKSFYLDNFNFPRIYDRYELKSSKDIEFASCAQNSIVNDTVLPSGLKIPNGKDGRNWTICGNEVILV
jgi:hypothetical protein